MGSLAVFYDNLSNPHRVMPGRSYPERIAPLGETLQPVKAARIRPGAKDCTAHHITRFHGRLGDRSAFVSDQAIDASGFALHCQWNRRKQ
jgi:hypothetical protein